MIPIGEMPKFDYVHQHRTGGVWQPKYMQFICTKKKQNVIPDNSKDKNDKGFVSRGAESNRFVNVDFQSFNGLMGPQKLN